MESVLRAAAVYLGLLLLLRLTGKRTLSDMTTFDFVLLLILSESVQPALVGNDDSLTNGAIVVATLVGIESLLGVLKRRFAKLDKAIEGTPLVIVEDGRPIGDRMERSFVDEADVLTAARERMGLERMDQIKFAVLERTGGISVIPKEEFTRRTNGEGGSSRAS